MTSLWGSLAPAQPRGLFGTHDDWLLTSRAINGLGFGPMTQATQAGRQNGYISNGPTRPNDYMAPVAETISPTMGGYGAGQMIGEGSRAIGQGDYLSGGAGLALGMAGMIPGAPKGKGIRAFHGSPHDFDRFDMSKIGTGEGAQAYGHGLYFAENEGVAKSYRDELSARSYPHVDEYIKNAGPFSRLSDNDAKALRELSDSHGLHADSFLDYVTTTSGPSDFDNYRRVVKAAKAIDKKIADAGQGRLYEVRINADPEDFLDWDKPLSQQSEKVRAAFLNSTAWPELLAKQRDQVENLKAGRSIFQPTPERVAEFSAPLENRDVSEIMQNLHLQNSTNQLREAGIPGIRYLDQGSRGAGDGSRNYVVFDDALIEIMKKYGLFGSLGLGGASGLFGAAGEQSQ